MVSSVFFRLQSGLSISWALPYKPGLSEDCSGLKFSEKKKENWSEIDNLALIDLTIIIVLRGLYHIHSAVIASPLAQL